MEEVAFTDTSSEKVLKLEKDLAYLYGAKEPELIVPHYINALKCLEAGFDQEMRQHLKTAYEEVQRQTGLVFDVEKAAGYEYSLILAQSKQASFEEINAIMLDLYTEVFSSNSPSIAKAAMMRTFLYKYKVSLLKNGTLSDEDVDLMVLIARASERELRYN